MLYYYMNDIHNHNIKPLCRWKRALNNNKKLQLQSHLLQRPLSEDEQSRRRVAASSAWLPCTDNPASSFNHRPLVQKPLRQMHFELRFKWKKLKTRWWRSRITSMTTHTDVASSSCRGTCFLFMLKNRWLLMPNQSAWVKYLSPTYIFWCRKSGCPHVWQCRSA